MSIEFLVATAVGVLSAAGIYLVLRARTFPVVLGLAFMSYAINVFLFASGRLVINQPPIWGKDVEAYTDPLPQALVLTAIVIAFGMTALVVVLALRAYLETGTDQVDGLTETSGVVTPPAEESAVLGPGSAPREEAGR
jgi:multicomponent K+:H+ antiporter subunit C